MEIDSLSRPLLFPCADRVKVPQVGSDESKLKSHFSFLSQSLPPTRTQDAQGKIHQDYVKKISTDLLFSEAVIRKHAAHTLPYNKVDLNGTFDSKGIVKKKPLKKIGSVGRHTQHGYEKKHTPCHITTVSEHKLKPLQPKKKKIIPDRDDEIVSEAGTVLKGKNAFLTETEQENELEEDAEINSDSQQNTKTRPKESENWDSHVLMNLSKATARWIVNERTPQGPQKDRLTKLLVEKFGEASQLDTLIRDDTSVSETGVAEQPEQRAESRSSKKQKSAVSEARKNSSEKEKKEGEEGGEDENDEEDVNTQPLASFYRLPGGVRRKHRQLAIDSLGAINTTAQDIQVFRRKPKPPPTLKDVMNPAIGDKMLDTHNQFEQEWLLGAQVIHQPSDSKLHLDSGNVYQVSTRKSFPQDPVSWHTESKKKTKDRKSKKDREKKKIDMPQHGYKKWNKLPEPMQEELMDIHEAGYDAEAHREPDPTTFKRHKENPSLVQLVDEWRNKWHLGSKWYDSSINDLERDMNDINEHVRLQAIATIAKAATFRPPDEPGSVSISKPSNLKSRLTGIFTKVAKDATSHGVLPAKLLTCVEKSLFDPSPRVCVTAAIALYTLNRPNEEARKILKDVIKGGSGPERWAAAQCLAHAGVCDSFVVGELVKQLFDSENMVKHEQCIRLLTNLSRGSSIVHSMVAEQLNSTSWRHRIVACRTFPRLYGTINKDITHKLSNLMWNDWHREVRTTAAQTLGRTGHGKDVHDDLRDRLLNGSERDRIDALQKIGHLGIMTARLLPSYLKCFDDPYIAVRIATTETASKLELKDHDVLMKLLFLTEFDSNWKVKAHALKALGNIGESNKHIESAVLWALRFESQAGVRAEACQTMIKLSMKDPEIPALLQEKLLVEPDQVVREQLVIALESFGVSATGDMEMVQQIKDEVRRLCTRYNIAAKITLNEEREDLAHQHKRFFDSSPAPSELVKSDVYVPSPSTTRPSTKHSTRTITPSIYISIDDDYRPGAETPEVDLPKTPGSTFATDLMGNRLSPAQQGSRPNTGNTLSRTTPAVTPTGVVRTTSAGRRTPEERLNKLIEVYEGSASLAQYQEFKQGDLGVMDDGNVRKLSQIPEAPTEEVSGDITGQSKVLEEDEGSNDVFHSDVVESRLDQTVMDNVDVPLMGGEVMIPYPRKNRWKNSAKEKQENDDDDDEEEDSEEYEMDDDLEDDEEEELKKSILRPTPEPGSVSRMTSGTRKDDSRPPSN
ncbi:HEAT repeat-containing protein 4 isoform X2 [Strongylocentrotus purpuratus]|uniref:HEAT repeat-containing protein 4 n=1 Tax=Strongylocentrotus purpuratus TaxID=7668 RepID=A0A7M7NXY4_STRPU|nr:HEAT repeat-containing protein 4 isoform X2 [Strongylocentrotus purpuratus]